jgi:hypothetical protein
MLPCPVCARHVRLPAARGRCPFCDGLLSAGRVGGAVALLGLGLQGCGGTPVPLYGAPVTDSPAEQTGDTAALEDTGQVR